MGMISMLWNIITLFSTFQYSSTYRLNVPRVLLPYHPSIPVTFLLEVSQPSGGCFSWRSTRPDVVSVSAIGTNQGECSDKAEIRSTAKAVSGELSAVIFAEDSASSTMLSCGVSVDLISRIRIETTTKILFVDAAPAQMIVEAFNSEGDKFSTLSEIPIDWELSHTGDGRPLRIVPFEQSTYEAPNEIMKLENNRKKGSHSFHEQFFQFIAVHWCYFSRIRRSGRGSLNWVCHHISAHSLDLTVVANLLLLPAHDLFVPVYAVVPFQVQIIPMPSSDYYLKVDSESVCKLDRKTSSVQALTRGRTDIHLLSQNVDVKAKTGVRPPSTAIYVVDPETIQWIISGGGNWLLQTGTRYKISVSLVDPHGNTMYISNNLRFESTVAEMYFDVHFISNNQTYFEVTPRKVGKTILKSRFVAAIDEVLQLSIKGNIHEATGKVTSEQSVQIVDPVRILPKEVVLPYLPRRKTSFVLKATGGSGLYDWSTGDTSVCIVDSNGVLGVSSPGTTVVVASDKRNPAHKDSASVSVLDVLSLTFGETRKEAEVGSDLIVNIQLMGASSHGLVPFTDCRAADFRVQSSDNDVFRPVTEYAPVLPSVGTGCSTVMLKAISSGDAKITVLFDHYEAVLDLSSYPPLEVTRDNLALAVGSSLSVAFEGGPRPWVTDISRHYRQAFAVVEGRGVVGPVVISAEMLAEGRNRSKRLVKASLDFRVVESAVAEPPELVLWNEESAVGMVKLNHGSGHFRVHELPGMPFTAIVKDSTVMLTPRSRGAGTLRIEDVCINGEYIDVPVKITDIHSLVIYGPQIMEVGTEVEVFVDAVDEDGISFSGNHGALSDVTIDSSDTAVHITNGVTLIASARPTSGRTLTSRPHSIQIFSPLVLLPQKVTLIPESTFQLEVFGGPQPTPHIDFTLNNSETAHIDPNALITSKNLGCTSITGSVKVGGKHSTEVSFSFLFFTCMLKSLLFCQNIHYFYHVFISQSTSTTWACFKDTLDLLVLKVLRARLSCSCFQSAVTLCVVSLTGIQVITSTHVVERGAHVWVRINGLDESETPFSFGGAIHPFKVTWSVSHPNVLKVVHPFGPSVSEADENRFAIYFEGDSVGSAVVKVRVELSTLARNHFVGRSRVYEDNVKIRVEEPLSMPRLNIPISSIRIAQNTQMQLETTPQSSVEFSVPHEFSRLLSVSKSGLVRSNLMLGPAALVVRRLDFNNETSMIPVTVSGVHAIDVILLTKIDSATSIPLLHLPVGVKLRLQVVFRDSQGRPLNEASSSISYRPHRFDLTEIISSNLNKTLTVAMKSAGETVLQIWNTADHSQNVFLRFSANEQLYPRSRPSVVSDIVCFASPLVGAMRWSSSDDRIEWLDVEHGVGRLIQDGRTHVTVNVAEQMLTTSITIRPAQQLLFSEDTPNFVTNSKGSSFVFPVNIFANETFTSGAKMTERKFPINI
uniref:BIG2 domain-containing protein n=1 Tax=Angiostrongylus cantonensis TaxID=6313 RepID=A0A158PBW9_ANGCA